MMGGARYMQRMWKITNKWKIYLKNRSGEMTWKIQNGNNSFYEKLVPIYETTCHIPKDFELTDSMRSSNPIKE
jgi:hypothetical protein